LPWDMPLPWQMPFWDDAISRLDTRDVYLDNSMPDADLSRRIAESDLCLRFRPSHRHDSAASVQQRVSDALLSRRWSVSVQYDRPRCMHVFVTHVTRASVV
jgi:hypothetical protein